MRMENAAAAQGTPADEAARPQAPAPRAGAALETAPASPTPAAAGGAARAPLRVLLVEDNPGDVDLLREALDDAYALQQATTPVDLIVVDLLSAGLARLEAARTGTAGPIDVVLLDLSLPDSLGFETFCTVRAQAPDVPVVVLSGLTDEALAATAVREGAQDYLVKGQTDGPLLLRSLRYAVERARAEREHARLVREQAERAQLEAARQFLEAVLRQMPAGVIIAEAPSGRILLGNGQVDQILRRPLYFAASVEEYAHARAFHPDGRLYEPHEWPLARAIARGETVEGEEVEFLRGDGTRGIMRASAAPIRGEDGRITAGVLTFFDVTERRRAEEGQRFLADASQALAASLDVATNLQRVAALAATALGTGCAIDVLDDPGDLDGPDDLDGPEDLAAGSSGSGGSSAPDAARRREGAPGEGTLRRVALAAPRASAGESAAGREPAGPAPVVDRRDPCYRVLETGRPLVYAGVAETGAGSPDPAGLAYLRSAGVHGYLGVPLVASGRTIGVLSLAAAGDGPRLGELDLHLTEQVAGRCGVAIENARLYRAAQRAREQSQRQAGRMQALAEASRAFAAATLDLPALLETIVRHVAELVGDGCALFLCSDDGTWLEPAALYHPDAEGVALARSVLAAAPLRIGEGVSGRVAATGEPLLIEEEEHLRRLASPDHRQLVERFGIHSVCIVPLHHYGRVTGTMGIWRDASAQPYTREDQAFLQDLADRAAQTVENARLYRQAQEAIRIRDDFLAAASHDLKNPLAAIGGTAQVLQRTLTRTGNVPPERLTPALQGISGAVGRMTAQINELLDITRARMGRPLDLERRSTDLVALVARVVEAQQHASERHHLRLTVTAGQPPVTTAVVSGADVPAIVGEWDAARLERVVDNLLSNAVKYSPGGGDVVVDLCAEPDGDGGDGGDGSNGSDDGSGWATLSVRDYGMGIPAADLPHVFERFTRASNVVGRIGGTGIGLAAAKHIVEQHGGTIVAESQEGEGTSFTIRLPLPPPSTGL